MIRAVIADDSAVVRSVLKDVLNTSSRIEVIAQAENGKRAVDLVKKLNPDVLVLDCEMPIMDGLEALQIIMKECPIPVFMFSSLTSQGAAITIKALEYGAVDFLLKPSGGEDKIRDVAKELITKLSLVVMKGRFKQMRQSGSLSTLENKQKKIFFKKKFKRIQTRKIDIIAIGSSTGGVKAATSIVTRLPEDLPPIVWVQHMPASFTKSFAGRLDMHAKMKVKEAQNGDVLEAGTCYIANGSYQMVLRKKGEDYAIKFDGHERINGHCPSCDVLFNSVSTFFGHNALGVILTGMGDDGAKGLLKMHKKGTYVIGQNEETCVVYGMPKKAFEVGAVDIELPIEKIAEGICAVSGRNVGEKT